MLTFCEYCRFAKITKPIHRPKDHKGSLRRPYILVCEKCIKENNLEDIPEYEISKLQKLVNHDSSVSPTLLTTTDGQDYLALRDGLGQYLFSEDLKFIAESLLKTAELEGLDEFLEETNTFNGLASFYAAAEEDPGRFAIPLDELRISRKQFDISKNWGCTCGNCSNKMSSKDGGEYFSIVPEQIYNVKSERACSEGCAYVIAKEIVLNWLNNHKHKKYFYIENLDENIKNYIKQS